MKPVKIAQIGMGHDHAYPIFNTLLRQSEHFEVIGGAELDGNEWGFPKADLPRYTVEELLNMPDLQAVTVECEELQATEIAQKFAERGIAVHMDKPGSPDLAAFERLIRTCKDNDTPFHMGYMYRYNPAVQEALAVARRGDLGEILSVEAQMSVVTAPEKRQWLARFPGGMMWFLGCHLVDMVLLFQGEPDEVIPLNCCTDGKEVTSEDFAFAVMKYPHGVSFVKSSTREVNGFDRRQLVICGTKGTVEIRPWEVKIDTRDTMYTTAKWSNDQKDVLPWFDCSDVKKTDIFDRYDAMMTDFAEVVRGREPAFSRDYELSVFRLLMKCCERSE